MISYDRLFKLLKERNISQYKLWKKYKISKSRIYYLKHGEYVNTELLDKLCGILSCRVSDIMEIKDEPARGKTEVPGKPPERADKRNKEDPKDEKTSEEERISEAEENT